MTLGSQASPMLSGVPSVVAYFDLLASAGSDLMREAIEFATEKEFDHLHEALSNNTEWSQIADALHVDVHKKHLVYRFGHKDAARAAKVLEFGTPSAAPRPMLRKNLLSAQYRFPAAVEEYLDGVL